jgi:hypothetical protein
VRLPASLVVYPNKANSVGQPTVIFATTAEIVSLLHGAAEQSEVSQLFTGSIILVFVPRNSGNRDDGLKHAAASAFPLIPARVL